MFVAVIGAVGAVWAAYIGKSPTSPTEANPTRPAEVAPSIQPSDPANRLTTAPQPGQRPLSALPGYNEVGRRIEREHPDASSEELANLVQQAVERGEMVVIDGNGELAWSNQVPVGEHGRANDPPRGGKPAEPGDSGDVNSHGAGS